MKKSSLQVTLFYGVEDEYSREKRADIQTVFTFLDTPIEMLKLS